MKRRMHRLFFACFFIIIISFPGCHKNLKKDLLAIEKDSGRIRNVIIMIADGMGSQELGLLISYAKYAPHSIYISKGRITAIEKVIEAGTLGYAYHEAANVLVTDSAASATQIASGKKALLETIGINQNGDPAETILEKAKKVGKSTGLVSDTRLTHATPASFAAHQTHRSKENEIAVDLLNNKVDVMLSGGLCYWLPKEANDENNEIQKQFEKRTGDAIKIVSERNDSRNLLDEAEDLGYILVFTKDQLEQANNNKILGLFNDSVFPYRIDFNLNDPKRTIPSLKEMTIKALQILSMNKKGFFLMVESGLIDWSAHDNDAGTLLHEMIRFDETLDSIYEWVKGRNDTLLVVTADHETGGFSFSYSRENIPESKDFPGEIFKGEKFAPGFNFGSYDILDRIYNQKKSYQSIIIEFDSLPKEQKTPKAMAKIINSATEFPINEEEACAILAWEEKEYDGNYNTCYGLNIIRRLNDFREFYVNNESIRKDILGRIVAKQQNVVWSTGMHTNTPVPLIVFGPEKVTKKFGRLIHTTEWSQYAIDALLEKHE
ncbi:MAG: alkaline phosphatase [bacterium]